jgi:sec-independent protein translocase protein TatA
MKIAAPIFCAAALLASSADAFVPAVASRATAAHQHSSIRSSAAPLTARASVFAAAPLITARSQHVARRESGLVMGLFGLGAPEIAVIIAVAALVLGPDKLVSFAKDAGKMAGELKEVPKEFQAGINEGEASMKEVKKQQKVLEPEDAELSEK